MFSSAATQQAPIRQDGFESSFDSASTPPLDSLSTINHPFLKFASNNDNLDFADDLTGLISHERSTHSPPPASALSTSATSNSSTYQHNIFDISAPSQLAMHHNRDEFALQHREGTSPPENYSTGNRPDSAFPANFNSTLPALNSSMRYDPQPPRFDSAAANRTGFDAGGRPFDRNSFDAARQDRVHTSPTFSDHRFDNRSFAADRFDSTGRPFDPRFDHFSDSRRSDSFDQAGEGHHFGDTARFGEQEEHVNRFDPSHPGHHHALDKSWERHFTPSPDSPFAAGLGRDAGRPTTASTNATSRSRSRSRPPSVGPQRTTRSRRNGSFSSAASGRIGRSDSISSMSGTSPTRPHAIVIPGKNQWGSLGSAGGLNGISNGINGVGIGMGSYSASPESAFSLPTPDSGFPHSFSSAYGAFAGSKDGLTTPTSSSLPSLTGLPSLGGSQYHAPAPAPQQATQNKLDEKRRRRRESHNAVERRRRDNINERISELAGLIPEEMLDGAGGQGGNAGDKADKDKAGQSPGSPTSPMLDMLKMEDGDGAEGLNAPGTVTPTPASANDSKDKPNSLKANKGMILRKSVEYIRYLQQLVTAQGARNRELEDELRDYRGNGNGNASNGGAPFGGNFNNNYGNFGSNGFEAFNSGREFLTIQEEDIEMRDGDRAKDMQQAGAASADDRPQDDRPRGGGGTTDPTRGDSPLTAPSSSGGEEEDEDSDDEYVEGPKRVRRRTGIKKGQKTPRANDVSKVNGAKASPVIANALRRGRRGRSDETDEGMEE
ncbi:helix-loop-helix DNA-binding domain-containing protein [Schizophyllum fasciatum]